MHHLAHSSGRRTVAHTIGARTIVNEGIHLVAQLIVSSALDDCTH